MYRYEKSGVIHGLTTVRGLTIDDAHIFCARDQMGQELHNLLDFVLGMLRDYGLTDFYLELSTRDESEEKFVGDPERWEGATTALREAAEASGLELVPDSGGAAFYGPKISVQARDAIGRTWQLSTIQVDFNHPLRFDLEFQAADGSRQRPVMIHRALFGADRTFPRCAAGTLRWRPAAMACAGAGGRNPDQRRARVVSGGGCARAGEAGHPGRGRCQRRQDAEESALPRSKRVPYMLLAGDDDVARSAVSFRYRSGGQKNGVPINEAVAEIVSAVENHTQV